MLVKNTRASVATVAVALITGLMVALWVALMAAPAHALCKDGPPCNPNSEGVTELTQCSDNKDNDGDELKDYGTGANNDPGCASLLDDSEDPLNPATGTTPPATGTTPPATGTTPPATGTTPPATGTTNPKQCEDGKDNDGDGKIDFGTGANNDPGCDSLTDDTENTDPNTPPKIDPIKPVPGSKIRNRRPLIAAKVSDAETDLPDRSHIHLYVDGNRITNISYDTATDRLRYRSGKLKRGKHTVMIRAWDSVHTMGENTWNFKVVRRH
jgi:hypothetical protein